MLTCETVPVESRSASPFRIAIHILAASSVITIPVVLFQVNGLVVVVRSRLAADLRVVIQLVNTYPWLAPYAPQYMVVVE